MQTISILFEQFLAVLLCLIWDGREREQTEERGKMQSHRQVMNCVRRKAETQKVAFHLGDSHTSKRK